MKRDIQTNRSRCQVIASSLLVAAINTVGCGDQLSLHINSTSNDRQPAATAGKSPNDPHVPYKGPWFEGWYTRISDFKNDRSVAVIVASHLPTDMRYEPGMSLPGYIAVLVHQNDGTAMQSFEVYPEKTRMLVGGEPVARNPGFGGTSDFAWLAEGFGSVTEDTINVEIPGVVSVDAVLTERRPWDSWFSEAGPEGLLAFLPLPLHWHIHSLGSKAKYAVALEGDHGPIHLSGSGLGHTEKNWGRAFPDGWIWSQGFAKDNGAQFVIAGGALTVGLVTVEPWLIGYREGKLAMDFQVGVPGTVFERTIDACRGTFAFTVRNPFHTLHYTASAPLETFGPVSIPTTDGFVAKGGVESFAATVHISAFEHSPLEGLVSQGQRVAQRTFEGAALEFGAGYQCFNHNQ